MGPLYCALISQIAIILAFAIIGAGLKYIDDAFDEDRFSKKKAIVIAPIIVLVACILAIKDTASQTILFSILLSVLIGGKVDNGIFKVSSIAFLLLLSLPSFYLYGTMIFFWMPLIIITITGIIDEKGNDYVDENKTNKLIHFFFEHRFSMKIGMLTVCVFQFLGWFYLFAFLAFDGAYESIRIYGYLYGGNKFHLRRKIPFFMLRRLCPRPRKP